MATGYDIRGDKVHPTHPFPYLTLLFALGTGPGLLAESCPPGDDRCGKYEDSRREAQEETEKQLRPRQQMHDMKRMEHLRRAEQARARQDFSTAQREEKMAMMEQMKSQQLEQQIQKNREVGDQNRDSRDLVSKNDSGSTGDQLRGYDANVVSQRKGTAGASAAAGNLAEEPEASPPAPADVATFEDYRPPPPSPVAMAPEPPPPAAPELPPTKAPSLIEELENISRSDRFTVGFRDDRPGAPGSGKPGAAGAAEPHNRLLASATGQPVAQVATTLSAGGSGGAGTASPTGPAEGAAESPATAESAQGESGTSAVETVGEGSGRLATAAPASRIRKAAVKDALDEDFFVDCALEEDRARRKKHGRLPKQCRELLTSCEKQWKTQEETGRDEGVSGTCRQWKEKRAELKKAAAVKETLDRLREAGTRSSAKPQTQTARRPVPRQGRPATDGR